MTRDGFASPAASRVKVKQIAALFIIFDGVR
jgi:hypothetical protein